MVKNLKIEETPLIIVDVQNGFVNRKSEHIIPAINEIIDKWESNNGTVIFTKFINKPNSFWRSLIGWNRLAEAPETDIVNQLDSTKGLVVDKYTYSSLTDKVKELFNKNAWDSAVICGIATESCVLKTAVDLFENNIVPWVISDAISSHAGKETHNAGILVMSRFIGKDQIISKETLFSVLEN